MIDYIAYILVRGLNKILSIVPISASLWLGRRIGSIVFFFNKKRRLVAYANLKAAFAGDKKPSELRAITKRVYQNMVQTFVEVLQLTKVNKSFSDKYVEVVKFDRMINASKSGRGTILLTAHFGDWELSSLVSSVLGFPISVLVREQKMKRLNELLNLLRESNGCKVIRKGMEVKNLIRALKLNEIVGVLSDQDAGRNGMFVDFFGRPTSCHSGPFEIAKRTGSLILPNFIVRTGGPYHKVYLEEYIDLSVTDSPDDIKNGLQQSVKLLESYIRKYPDQWLWLHKRWKSTPVRTVLVLDDGKVGHLNQSLSVASAIQRARTTQGRSLADTKIVIVKIKYKNNFARGFLAAAAVFAGWRCQGRMRCMKMCLRKDTYNTLMKTYSEFVVSCGSSLSAVNIFMSRENNAKNVVVMDPNIFTGLGKFTLAVIPGHDDPPLRHNVVVTELAPNLIDRDKFKSIASGVGLLIGGDNPEFTLSAGTAEAAMSAVKTFCRASGSKFFVTTSRRTRRDAEDAVKRLAAGDNACAMCVIASDSNPEGTVERILSECGTVVVSAESISMVSEAITAGRKVIALRLEKKVKRATKHERILGRLERQGFIRVADPSGLAAALEDAARDSSPAKTVDDNAKIFEAVRRLI